MKKQLSIAPVLMALMLAGCSPVIDSSDTPPEQTARPAVTNSIITKTAAPQVSVEFTLKSGYGDAVWKVYSLSTGDEEAAGIGAANDGTALTLSHATDIPEGTYYVTAALSGQAESARIRLTVEAYAPPDEGPGTADPGSEEPESEEPGTGAPELEQTVTPEFADKSVTKTAAPQAAADFIVTNYPPDDTIWKVYAGNIGSVEVEGIHASNTGVILTLSHDTDIPEGDYWVTAALTGKTESGRVKLTVAPMEQTETPAVFSIFAIKHPLHPATADFTLTNSTVYAGALWKVYTTANGTTPAEAITASTVGETLTLTRNPDILAQDYWVTATRTGKTESGRLKLTAITYEQGAPRIELIEAAPGGKIELRGIPFLYNGPVNGYHLYRAEGITAPADAAYTKIAELSGGLSWMYADAEIVPGRRYWYRICSYNAYEESALSDAKDMVYLETGGK